MVGFTDIAADEVVIIQPSRSFGRKKDLVTGALRFFLFHSFVPQYNNTA